MKLELIFDFYVLQKKKQGTRRSELKVEENGM